MTLRRTAKQIPSKIFPRSPTSVASRHLLPVKETGWRVIKLHPPTRPFGGEEVPEGRRGGTRKNSHSLNLPEDCVWLSNCYHFRMSYDIDIWSCLPIDSAKIVIADLGFNKTNDNIYILSGGNWQISLHQSFAQPEDIPDAIMAYQPGIAWFTSLILEPISAPASAYAKLRQVVKVIVRATTGIAEDKQLSTYIVPPGHVRFRPPKRQPRERFDVLQLSWWWNHDRFQSDTEVEALLQLLNRQIPEALPYRYGLYEPPGFMTAKTGISGLAELMVRDNLVVCYTKKPVCGLSVGFHKAGMAQGFGEQLYRSSYMNLEFDSAVLDMPEWNSQIRLTWAMLCEFIDPYFSDVRILRNMIASGATYAVDGKSEKHPIRAGWWTGVPDLNCIAMAFGGKLVDSWPKDSVWGKKSGSRIFLETQTWARNSSLAKNGIRIPSPVKHFSIQEGTTVNKPKIGQRLSSVFAKLTTIIPRKGQ